MSKPDDKAAEDAETAFLEKVTLDSIFANEIGELGRFQFKLAVLAAVVTSFACWSTYQYIFTTARIDTRCVIPECDGPQPEFSPQWLPNAIPATSNNSYDNCKRFGNTSTFLHQMDNSSCPRTLFDRNIFEPCKEFVYENEHSVAYDYGLACDEWSRSLLGTVRLVGTLISLQITGFVSDRWGRSIALTFNAFNQAWLGLIRFWTNTYLGFMLSDLFETICGAGDFTSMYILVIELMGPNYRVLSATLIDIWYAVSEVQLGLIAWSVPNWRYLTLVLYVPQLLTISFFWLVPESVRWYMSKGRLKDSEALLRKIAKTNGTQLSERSLKALRDTAIEEAKHKELHEELRDKEPWLIVELFRHKQVLLRCLVTPVWWVTTNFVCNGLSINAVNTTGENKYLAYITVSLIGIPGVLVAIFLINKIGRKPLLIGGYWTCALCQVAYIFIPQNLYAVSFIVYLIAKCSISTVLTTLYIYTTELYPTKHRHTLFAYSATIGRIGSMIAPLTPAFSAQWFKELPFVLFASFALLSGALVFLTPETLGSKLPDTLEEASRIGHKDNTIK